MPPSNHSTMEIKLEYTRDTHKHLMFLKAQVRDLQQRWSEYSNPILTGRIVGQGKYTYTSSASTSEMHDEAEKKIQGAAGNRFSCRGFFDYLDDIGDSIKAIRKERKNAVPYNPIKLHKKLSNSLADRFLKEAFPRSPIRMDRDAKAGLQVEGESKYTMQNYISVGVGWSKTVWERGFCIINAPSGFRFVLRCKPFDVQYVEADNMNAWHVTTIGFKHGKGSMEDGWLITHKSTDHNADSQLVDLSKKETSIPHAYGTSISKAHSLMKSRTVRHLTKMLDA